MNEKETTIIKSVEAQALNTLRQKNIDSWKSGNLDGFMDGFSDDVIWMPPGQAPVIGKDVVKRWAQETFPGLFNGNADGFYDEFTVDFEETVVLGDWAYERILLTMVYPADEDGDTPAIRLKGVNILQKQADDLWKITHYIWNDYPVE